MKKLALLIALCLALPFVVRAEDKPADKPKEDKPAATAPAGDVIEATDIEKLKAAAGKTVTAHGKVSGIFKAKSGRVLINFEGANRDFVAMIQKENADAVDKGFDGDVGNLTGKSINVTGEVALFKDKPQIEVTKAEQIVVADEYK
jgi:hypothetical protein